MIEYYKNLSLENLPYVNEEGLVCWEEFKDIPDYEELYQVSDLGRIKSLNYNHTQKEKLLKSCIGSSDYLTVVLSKDKSKKSIRVHQLVAVAFLNHKLCGHTLVVNHINFIKVDNRVRNLEIVTPRENSNRKHLTSSSEYVGVSWNKQSKKWQALIEVEKIKIYLGLFDNELEASKYYENALVAIENDTEIQIKKPNFTSKYKGVYFDKRKSKWISRIVIKGNKVVLG